MELHIFGLNLLRLAAESGIKKREKEHNFKIWELGDPILDFSIRVFVKKSWKTVSRVRFILFFLFYCMRRIGIPYPSQKGKVTWNGLFQNFVHSKNHFYCCKT